MQKPLFYNTILMFLLYISTWQDPLVFEYSSTALAILSAAEP